MALVFSSQEPKAPPACQGDLAEQDAGWSASWTYNSHERQLTPSACFSPVFIHVLSAASVVQNPRYRSFWMRVARS